jgi:AcrR family transcriptional regulator
MAMEGSRSVEPEAPVRSAQSQDDQTASRPRARRRGERTRTAILDHAERIFSDRGFDATTLGEIAAAAGIRAPSLYEYFDSKESLYDATLERACEPLFSILDDYAGKSSGPADARPNLLAKVLAVFRERPHLPRLMHQEALLGGPHLQRILQERTRTLFGRALDVLDRLPSGGRWRPEEVPFVGLAMMHACTCYYSMAPLYKTALGLDLLSEEMQDKHAEFLTEFWQMLWFDPPTRPRGTA